PRGMRVQSVVQELKGEKIDIVEHSIDPERFIGNALSPARVMRVFVNEAEKSARAVVPDHQLSLAIGREGQNARLAARLTGWKIDIKSESQMNELLRLEAQRAREEAQAKAAQAEAPVAAAEPAAADVEAPAAPSVSEPEVAPAAALAAEPVADAPAAPSRSVDADVDHVPAAELEVEELEE